MSNKTRRGGFSARLVEPYTQVKLGLMFLMVNLIFSILILSVFGYYTYDIYNTMSAVFKLTPTEGQQILDKFTVPVLAGGVLIVIFVCTTLFVSIHYTHQIYGPLVSIQRFLDELLGGNRPKKLALRSSDQLQELAGKLNGIAETMEKSETSGPLIAIHTYLDAIIEGKTPEKLELRKDDPFKSLAEKINKLTSKL